MMQPGTGVAPPPMAQNQQYQQQQQQQQPWMMAPQQPMWNQQPQMPPQQFQQQPQVPPQQQPPQQYAQPANPNEIRTLWIGDLQYWMDENYVYTCFAQTNEVATVKLIRNKQTNQLEGYGFVEFVSRAAAERVLQTFNGTLMPSVEQNFRLNWASFSAGERRSDDTPEYTIFVGDLAPDVSDYVLQETFRQLYPSVKGAKVVTDKLTGRTKGYGFVKFGDESEQQRAMTEMNGQLCSSRPMRIGAAANKNTPTGQQFPKVSYQSNQGNQSENDPNNTTIFVGGLDPNVSDEALKQHFEHYGEIVHVKIPVGKRCGFVQFTDRSCAEQALNMLNGTQLGNQSIRLSWGRTPSNRQNPSAGAAQPQADPNSWNSGYYGYGNGYEAYGYAPAAPQDPNMYYTGGYSGYGNYQQPPQQQQ
uniref:RRM domain-containing protein n=2 Tax=Kalanchoe fedtschenkoi TaxID=63787 RepID=A0A7N0UE88_KALFE